MPTGIDRTLRGAVSGAVAAGVWAAQQPIDKRVFDYPYDDVEMLGRAVRPHGRWFGPGLAMHLVNGAAFGAAYANLAASIPVAPVLRGPVAALAENFGTWKFAFLVDRFHPARSVIPPLAGSRRALAQATWRHLLFGVVLGELERRLNAVPDPVAPAPPTDYSSNGHGPPDGQIDVTAVVGEQPDPGA